MIPLEDNFADVLGKALRGHNLDQAGAARAANLDPGAVARLLGGHFEVLFHNSSVVLPHARSGSARLMGITSAERMASLSDVPTVAEAAGLQGFAVTAWFGLYAPTGTPSEILTKLNADVSAVLARADVKGWIEQQGGVAGGGSAQALADHQAAETRKRRELIRAANIKAD